MSNLKPLESARYQMVAEQLKARDIHDTKVLAAMMEIPRHQFLPPDLMSSAYEDCPLPIDARQTISQPYIVALMTQLLSPKPDDKILEIGTGSGYQTAVLSRLVQQVFTIEVIPELAKQARKVWDKLELKNIRQRIGNGYQGWAQEQPFDGIIVTAAPPNIPKGLLEQLILNRKMVVPVGTAYQDLIVLTKLKTGIEKETICPVRFVPMVG